MMMRVLIAGVALLALAAPATAAMTVNEFLAKADALKAKGILAIGSSDIALLRQEIATASDVYRAGLAAQVAAGKKPSSCPPPKGTAKIGSDDIINEFRALPAAKRKTSVNAAFAAFMTKRYPCKG
ncbi:hypothetical protein [Sphingomonas sp.]|uniref:hypothetical protein n=1 Tax=Sphingomonas sp. TaxID=28214 RepID=UPI0035A88FF2